MSDPIVFEVRRVVMPICSYPSCNDPKMPGNGRSDGQPRAARYWMRKAGTDKEWVPICYYCKAYVKAITGASERKVQEDGTVTADTGVSSA